MTVTQAVQSRRSTLKFVDGVEINRAELTALMNAACLAPSSLNLQPWRFVTCTSAEDKQRLMALSHMQAKVGAASAVVVLLGDLRHHENAERVAEDYARRGAYSAERKQEYVDLAVSAYDENPVRQRDEMFRGCSLWAMTFMLLAQEAGWDTAPLAGFRADLLVKEFGIPERYLPIMLIAVGKAAPTEITRAIRFSAEELELSSRC